MNHVSEFGLPKKRKKTIDILEKAFADGDLDQHDYENRLEVALEAKSKSELDDVLSDFPSHYKPKETVKTSTFTSDRIAVNQDPNKLSLSILSGRKEVLSNTATAPSRFFTLLGETKITLGSEEYTNATSRFEFINVLGESVIDLRDKCLEGAVIHLRVMISLGEVKIKVAPGTIVTDQSHKVLGENVFKKRSKTWTKKIKKAFTGGSTPVQAQSIDKVNCQIIIEGFNLLGSLNILEYDV
ncbi:DUF1707 SHOCT-like domain-containing protein [Flammeovirga pacifica]|uniref:DUF1707 domain-containing protein n=1 Tax=Flammeovirga pacifica TaxID=915059 RepID=A0A1S1YYU6_FLAPC|nr:DUF1707 domain-containing protein [Flammeovirga pacifica]OHX66172.1 hypothetical protein NH26_07310 [Flammeovirga pacifica]